MISTTKAWRQASGTIFLIAANCLIFFAVAATGSESWVANTFGLHPPQVDLLNPMFLLTIFTSAFLHHDSMHLFTNVLLLLWTGLIVEGRLGTVRFLLFYAVAIVFCGSIEIISHAHVDTFVSLGASGAVGAVIGATGAILILERFVSTGTFGGATITMCALMYVTVPLNHVLPDGFTAGTALLVLCQLTIILLRSSPAQLLLMAGLIGWLIVQTAIYAYLAQGPGSAMISVAWEVHAAGLLFGAAVMTWLGLRSIRPSN